MTNDNASATRRDIDELAAMMSRGFESMATKENLKAFVTKVEFKKDIQRLENGQKRILEAILGVPSKESFERFETRVYDHEKRINTLERKTT